MVGRASMPSNSSMTKSNLRPQSQVDCAGPGEVKTPPSVPSQMIVKYAATASKPALVGAPDMRPPKRRSSPRHIPPTPPPSAPTRLTRAYSPCPAKLQSVANLQQLFLPLRRQLTSTWTTETKYLTVWFGMERTGETSQQFKGTTYYRLYHDHPYCLTTIQQLIHFTSNRSTRTYRPSRQCSHWPTRGRD